MFSRKEFLKLIGIASLAAMLDACSPSPKKTPEAILPTSTNIPPTLTLEPTLKVNSPIIPEMVLVEPGDFEMGSTDGYANEQPIHLVTISKHFYISYQDLQ